MVCARASQSMCIEGAVRSYGSSDRRCVHGMSYDTRLEDC
jgi:hypothetical protein